MQKFVLVVFVVFGSQAFSETIMSYDGVKHSVKDCTLDGVWKIPERKEDGQCSSVIIQARCDLMDMPGNTGTFIAVYPPVSEDYLSLLYTEDPKLFGQLVGHEKRCQAYAFEASTPKQRLKGDNPLRNDEVPTLIDNVESLGGVQ